MPTTVDAILLLGWMERDTAVKYLQEECVFESPLTIAQAEEMWRTKRDAVDALGTRRVATPTRLTMDVEEDQVARRFMDHFNPLVAANVKEVLKIDPMDLVIHQLFMVLDRVAEYSPQVATKDGWIRHCLSTDALQSVRLQLRCGRNAVDAMLPHGDFIFTSGPTGGFGIQEFHRHVIVNAFDGRLWLWAGYHRSYARIASLPPDAMDRSLLVVRTTDADFLVASDSPNPVLRNTLRGLRPPLFRDFFDEGLFARVKLRKKRYELQIRAQVLAINVD